jgi:mRNA-degrading endonuclease RelE of RelBE toxin-antitoxin system
MVEDSTLWELQAYIRDKIRGERIGGPGVSQEQRYVVSWIEQQLSLEPVVPTRRRKPLRPNALATWELRLGAFRVFYEVDPQDMIVWIKAVGRKEHNCLLIRGKEVSL